MKKIIALMLAVVCVVANADSAIEGDINNDGMLSGSEQYLLNNPESVNANSGSVRSAIQSAKIQAEINAQQEEMAVAANIRTKQQNNSAVNQSSGMGQAPHINGMQDAMNAKYSSRHSDTQSQIDGQNAQMNAQLQQQQAQLQQQQAAQQRLSNQLDMQRFK